MKILILQRVIPNYRVCVFKEITANKIHDISLIIGQDLNGSKAKNAGDLSGIKYTLLPARGINLFGRFLTIHIGLLSTIKKACPDIIVCEAESHFLGYLTAIFYKFFFDRKTKLILWCFYALPGKSRKRSAFHALIKRFVRVYFDGFISYGDYGKKHLITNNIPEHKITVAVNVCDTKLFLEKDAALDISKEEAKKKLGVENRFVASFVGTLDSVKKPDLILELARRFEGEQFHFFIIGTGPLEDSLRYSTTVDEILNVTITGRVTDRLAEYYRASDVVLLPGRGGIVISEAMCFGVPVIVHQADGVEYNLVHNGLTGTILRSGDVNDFEAELRNLSRFPRRSIELGKNARHMIINSFNTHSMATSILSAIESTYVK